MWILYFTFVALRAILSAIRYARPVDLDLDKKYLFGMSITEMIFHALTAYFLTLALNYQRTWRSGNSMILTLNGEEDDLSDIGAVISPHRSSTNARRGKRRNGGKKPVSNSLLVDDDDSDDSDETHSDDEDDSDSQPMLEGVDSLGRRGGRGPFAGKSASDVKKAVIDYVFSLYFVALLLLLVVLLSIIFRARFVVVWFFDIS